ncbi:MAG TPA: sigma-70 family RNA polymerase sigma factor [Chloroflexota bacterium]
MDDATLLAALRRGDEATFVRLVERYGAALVRLAQLYTRDRAVAEEVAQETWQGLLQGLDRFEERSSLKTWLFRILVNRARTRAQREGRQIPFSALADPLAEGDEPSVDPERFAPPDHPQAGHWLVSPGSWGEEPEERLLAGEGREVIRRAIAELTPVQREVITLRDVEGWAAEEVCDVLGITAVNQRVLLHRARSRVRRTIGQYFGKE